VCPQKKEKWKCIVKISEKPVENDQFSVLRLVLCAYIIGDTFWIKFSRTSHGSSILRHGNTRGKTRKSSSSSK
jgi:hypothetical protein